VSQDVSNLRRARDGLAPFKSTRRFTRLGPRVIIFLLVAVGLAGSGCTIRLAPDYDRAIVDGLSTANEEAMTLFASASSGLGARPFSTREASYNSVIGKVEAVRVQVDSRPAPPSLGSQLMLPTGRANSDDDNAETPASPTGQALAGIAATLTYMRDTDRRGKLEKKNVPGFKNSFEIRMARALTYEKALQR
jgi:hypothetical protein